MPFLLGNPELSQMEKGGRVEKLFFRDIFWTFDLFLPTSVSFGLKELDFFVHFLPFPRFDGLDSCEPRIP